MPLVSLHGALFSLGGFDDRPALGGPQETQDRGWHLYVFGLWAPRVAEEDHESVSDVREEGNMLEHGVAPRPLEECRHRGIKPRVCHDCARLYAQQQVAQERARQLDLLERIMCAEDPEEYVDDVQKEITAIRGLQP